jgi:hypothetical protein
MDAMNELESLFGQDEANGLYRWLSPVSWHKLERVAQPRGWRVFHLDGRMVHDKASFLRAVAAALDFPDYFGRNWDAFEEMINDLSWTPAAGYILLYDHLWRFACVEPEAWAVARAILETTCAQWAGDGIPFIVLLRHTHGCSGVAPLLRAPRPHHRALRRRLR